MLSNRPLAALSRAERQLLRRQRLRSGQCVRCFHASIRKQAEEAGSGNRNDGSAKGNDSGTPYNQPQRGPTRHQRAAMISEEVRMLNRDTPALGPSKPPNDSADFAAGPQPTGRDAPADRMGENMPPEREGPLAQGVGRPVRSYDDEVDGTVQVRETRTPSGAIEEPTQGGASVMGERRTAQDQAGDEKSHLDQQRTTSAASPTVPAGARIPSPGTPYQPTVTSKEQLLQSSPSTSTIAAANFSNVVNERIRISTDSARPSTQRSIPELAHRLARKKIVQYESKEEKKAVENHLREHNGKKWSLRDQNKADKGLDTDPYFRPLPEKVRNSLVQAVVNGVCDSEGLMGGAQKHKQPVLDEIARMTMKNGTYLSGDGERFLKKVQSLLPATVQASPQRKGGAAGQAKQQKQARK